MVFLDWLLLTCLFCLSDLAVHSLSFPSGPPLPWVFWFGAGIFSGLYNRRLLAIPRSPALLLAANLPALALILAVQGIWQSLNGYNWPAALPGLLEMALYWPLAAYIAVKSLADEVFPTYWEGGLAVAAVLDLVGEANGVHLSSLLAWSGLYLSAGLARLTLVNTLSGRPAPGSRGTPFLPFVIVLVGGALALGLWLGTLSLDNLVDRVVALFIQGLLLLRELLIYLSNLLGLNPPPPVSLPSGGPGHGYGMSDQAGGGTAPLWFMIILWVVLAVMFLCALFLVCYNIYLQVRKLRRQRLVMPPPKRYALDHLGFLSLLAKAWLRLVTYTGKVIRRWWRAVRRLPPDDCAGLYLYFLSWGRRHKVVRQPWETPHEYLSRLLSHPPLAGPHSEELRQALIKLTNAFTGEYYGGQKNNLKPGQIKELWVRLLTY